MDQDPNAQPPHLALAIPPGTTATFSNATQVTVSDDSVIIQFAYIRPNAAPEGAGQLVAELALSAQARHRIQPRAR